MPYAGYFARRRWNQWHPARDISRRLGVLDVLGWIQDPADGKFYMWAASMAHNCTMGEWQTNSEVVLASATFPMGPYEKVKTVVLPWAHNPQAIRAPDNTTTSGHVYALYTLGDGYDYRGQPKVCNSSESRAPPPPRPPGPPMPWPPTTQSCPQTPPYNWPDGHWDKCMLNGAINFTIFFSETPGGDYQRHTAQILDWPAHSRGRPWEYGAYGNWNPSPVVHPNGTVYLLAHTEQFGFKHGEAILAADTWRGPYRLVASDSDNRWGGSTANAEDPFLWIDKRGNWHQLVEGNPMPGGHAFSTDGITWSDMAGCNGAYALEGCFNLTRQYVASNGSLANVSYYTKRPKLLLTVDGISSGRCTTSCRGQADGRLYYCRTPARQQHQQAQRQAVHLRDVAREFTRAHTHYSH